MSECDAKGRKCMIIRRVDQTACQNVMQKVESA